MHGDPSRLPIQDRELLGELLFTENVAYDQIQAVGTAVKTDDLIVLQGVPEEIFELDLAMPCCIMMGSEDKGLQPHMLKAADEHFSIPMTGDFDSFNVSVACGIMLYEAMKSRLV